MPGRVQHVQVNGIFGVESISGGGGSEANCDGFTGSQVQTPHLHRQVGICLSVDASPHADEFTARDAGFESCAAEMP